MSALLNRRLFLGAGGAGLTLAAGGPQAAGQAAATPRRLQRETEALFDELALMEMRAQPERVTRLGIAADARPANTDARLDDRSQAGFERLRLRRIEALRALEAMPLAPVGTPLHRQQSVVAQAYHDIVALQAFGYGTVGLGFARPYVSDHRHNALRDVAELLVNSQFVADEEGAFAYLARLAGLAGALDDERRRLAADAHAGIVPPDYILARMRLALAPLLARPAAAHVLVMAYDSLLTGAEGLTPADRQRLVARAAALVEARLLPAGARYLETLRRLQGQSGTVAGVWTLSEGEAYYARLLGALSGGGPAEADTLHEEARDRAQALHAALTLFLRAHGAGGETLAERLASASMPEPESAPAPAEPAVGPGPDLSGELTARLEAAALRSVSLFARDSEAALVVNLISAWLEPGHSAFSYGPPALDSSRPGRLYVNAARLAAWPAISRPALLMLAGRPGRHMAVAYPGAAPKPLICSLVEPDPFAAGWSTYALDQMSGLGAFVAEPLAHAGYLHVKLWREACVVVDTGLHRRRWNRREAIDFLSDMAGLDRPLAAAEVDRLVVTPGAGVGPALVAGALHTMRRRAEGVLGATFDPTAFHHELLAGGPRPLPVFEAELERWYEAQLPPLR